MRRLIVTAVLGASVLPLTACAGDPTPPAAPAAVSAAVSAPASDLVGVWASGPQPRPELRLELRADGSFTEDLGERVAAYQGRYQVAGDTFSLAADSGARATGTVVHGGQHLELSGYHLTRSGS
ncbi:Atu4866 domain-containing protein [Pseudonocardia acaciae]|uniref:Atu4866 domain-containing protein n=1 Tax=Pseudonocardia acaciae TaxID=551276 RepID=UPI000688E366|nr:Atu4866 domain-containing protein [Pseudonocardia acaciae]